MKEIRLSLPYNLSPLPVGYYDRYLQKVDTQTDLNFWTWMWPQRPVNWMRKRRRL